MAENKETKIEAPSNVHVIFSFPQIEYSELEPIVKKMKNDNGFSYIVTNMYLKVLAKNQHVIVIEGTRP
jgi:hypothetical protein